ncbi:hypothetical protein PQX77_002421 [Marasmius sp. AFHP31]|nr:hypothetical protein PQX77_002421 [Marasmius sp. AFHP31]
MSQMLDFKCNCKDIGNHTQIFVRNAGRRLKFAIHGSISDPETQTALLEAIVEHGGLCLEDPSSVDYVLFESNGQLTSTAYQNYFSSSSDPEKRKVLVKDLQFVEDVLKNGKIVEEVVAERSRPGFPAGRKRTEFTAEEDDLLCQFLAVRCPKGGRLGHILYVQMCELHNYGEDYEWTKTHPPSAWRERYRKNKIRMDHKIASYILQFKVGEPSEPETEEEDDEAPRIQTSQGSGGDPIQDQDDHEEEEEAQGEREPQRPSSDGAQDLPQDEEDEEEVGNALQVLSHTTDDDQPRASTSRSRPTHDQDSISHSAPVEKQWPPIRRRKRLSGVVTAPAPVLTRTAGRGSQQKPGPSRKGKEKAIDEDVNGVRNQNEEDGHTDGKNLLGSESAGIDFVTEDEGHVIDPRETQFETARETYDSADEDGDVGVGRHLQGKEDGPMSEGDRERKQGLDDDFSMSGVGPLFLDSNADDYAPPRGPNTRSPHSFPHSGPSRKVKSEHTTPAKFAEVIEETDLELMDVEEVPPPSSPVRSPPKIKPGVRKRKDYRQMAEVAPPRMTRARSRSAAPPSPPRSVRGTQQSNSRRQRTARKVAAPPDPVMEETEEEEDRDRGLEDIDMDEGEKEYQEKDEEAEVVKPPAKTHRLDTDDQQSLRALGLSQRDAEGTNVPRRRAARRPLTSVREEGFSTPQPSTARVKRNTAPKATVSPTTSTSSRDSFPLEQTRASAMKKKLVDEEKQTPYRPPAGTRAAAHSQNRRN